MTTEAALQGSELDELKTLVGALRAHADRLARTGATGLPAASSELIAERAQVHAFDDTALLPAAATTVYAAAPPRTPAAEAGVIVAAPDLAAAAPTSLSAADPAFERGVAASGAPSASDREARKNRLSVLESEVRTCRRCGLHATRTQTVFSRGSGSSGLMFVGEGPGADEDAQGFPFVGKAGQLLDRMIAAMGLERDEVYVGNIVKCRPPNNRKPEPSEMAECLPYLAEQVELVDPQVIVALGATAVQGLLGTSEGIMRIRGRWKLYRGKVPVMPTFHPAYLLRTPAAKREVWEDLKIVLKHLGRPIPSRR